MARTASLRVVVFQESDTWIAQALEHDICAQAGDLDSLYERFQATLEAEYDHARALGKASLDIAPAPQHFFQMWDERSRFAERIEGNDDGRVELALCA